MEREQPISITEHPRFHTMQYADSTNNFDVTAPEWKEQFEKIENPFQRDIWQCVEINIPAVEDTIATFERILGEREEDNSKSAFELRRLNKIREDIGRALGLSPQQMLKIRGYDMAFDGRQVENTRLDKNLSSEEKERKLEQVKRLVQFNLETGLRERLQIGSSTTKLLPVGGKLISEYWDEPIETVYERGAAVRRHYGSAETQRNLIDVYIVLAEQQLFLGPDASDSPAHSILRDVPLGTRVISLSPPSTRTKEYPDDYIDILQSKRDPETGKLYIELTRYKGTFSAEQYDEIIARQNSGYQYLRANKQLSIDERVKNTAFIVFPTDHFPENDQLVTEYFGVDKHAVQDTEFRATVLVAVKPAINEYIRALFREPIDWKEVHTCYENVLKIGDAAMKQLKASKLGDSYEYLVSSIQNSLGKQEYLSDDQRGILAHTEVETVLAGCGETGSYTENNGMSGYLSPFAGNVAMFGMDLPIDFTESDSMGSLYFDCPHCGTLLRRPREGVISYCSCGGYVGCGMDKKKSASQKGTILEFSSAKAKKDAPKVLPVRPDQKKLKAGGSRLTFLKTSTQLEKSSEEHTQPNTTAA